MRRTGGGAGSLAGRDGFGWRRTVELRASGGGRAWLFVVPGLCLLAPVVLSRAPALWLGPPAALVVLGLVGRRVGWRPIVLLAVTGVALRIALAGNGYSYVLPVTASAIEQLRAGLDPWGVGYASSFPPGAPFPYGPLALAWYLPFGSDLRPVELAASLAVLAALAVGRRPLGLAVYALSPVLAIAATDGSNDTSAGLLLLVALATARRSPVVGGMLLAGAAAFKLYALAWLPGLVVFGGAPALIAFVATSAALWGPAAVAFGTAPILASLARAATLHDQAATSLGAAAESIAGQHLAREPFEALRTVAAGAVAAMAMPAARTWAGMLAGGLAVFLVGLYAGYWASVSYLAAVGPILCWELDGLVGLPDGVAARSPEARLLRASGA